MENENHIFSVNDDGNAVVTIPEEDYQEYITLKLKRNRQDAKHDELYAKYNKAMARLSKFDKKKLPEKEGEAISYDDGPFKDRDDDKLTDADRIALDAVAMFMYKNNINEPIKREILFNIKLSGSAGVTTRDLMKTRLRIIDECEVAQHLEELKAYGVRQERTPQRGRPRLAWFWD